MEKGEKMKKPSRLTLEEEIQILEKEIEWCESDRRIVPLPCQEWFIAGLNQAIYLLRVADASVRDEE